MEGTAGLSLHRLVGVTQRRREERRLAMSLDAQAAWMFAGLAALLTFGWLGVGIVSACYLLHRWSIAQEHEAVMRQILWAQYDAEQGRLDALEQDDDDEDDDDDWDDEEDNP
jgi:hypothetical protein